MVQALVSTWITDARLEVPRPVTLVIDVGPLPEATHDPEIVFRHGRMAVHRGPGAGTLTLDWPGFGVAVLELGSTTAHVTITEAGLERTNELLRAFLLTVGIVLVRRAGLHHVHGATLQDPQKRGWLIAGTSGSGKSTTTALMARNGWSVGTDDIAFITAGDAEHTTDVVAWREQLALLEDAVVATGHSGGTALAARGKNGKTGWFVEDLGTKWVARITPEVLLFPAVRADSPTVLTPIRSRDALGRLMQFSAWVALEADLADEHLQLMTQLVKQSRAFDLSLGRDLFERPDMLLDVLA